MNVISLTFKDHKNYFFFVMKTFWTDVTLIELKE